MIELQYFNGTEWIKVGTWGNEEIAWATLGGDNYNYRTIDEDGKVLTILKTLIFKSLTS